MKTKSRNDAGFLIGVVTLIGLILITLFIGALATRGEPTPPTAAPTQTTPASATDLPLMTATATPSSTATAAPLKTATLRPTLTPFVLATQPPLRMATVDLNSGGSGGQTNCCKVCGPDSQACGDSCISRNKTCHQDPGCACQ